MIILPPYAYDRTIYHQLPVSDRKWMNKLILAERLGYDCGPVGAPYDPTATYCIRPIMNMCGNGMGGFYKFNLGQQPEGMGYHPGYFFSEWFGGRSRFTEFVDDVPVYSFEAPQGNTHLFIEVQTHIPMPAFLKGISRYAMLEAIGHKIIEVSFRHSNDAARQESIDDYRTIDPSYDPQDVELGLAQYQRVPAEAYRERGHSWEEITDTREEDI